MSSTRRTVLRLIGTSALGGFAGCGNNETESPMVSIILANSTSIERTIFIEVLPADIETDLSENTIVERRTTLGPSGTKSDTKELSDFFESASARIRIHNERGMIGEYTFIPDCSRDDELDEVVRVYIPAIDSVAFDQNTCP